MMQKGEMWVLIDKTTGEIIPLIGDDDEEIIGYKLEEDIKDSAGRLKDNEAILKVNFEYEWEEDK